MTWSGLYTPLITPFTKDNRLDEEGLCKLIAWQKEAGADGIVISGTTGESMTLTHKEKRRIAEIAIKEKGPLKVMIGTGDSSTDVTIELTEMAKELGADAALVVTPCYNRPTQAGIISHFEKIASKVSIPLCVYHNPSRTSSSLDLSTVVRLSEIPTVLGMKDSIPSVQTTLETLLAIKPKRPNFAYFCGDDPLLIPMMSLGADGIISASANVIPKEMKKVVTLCQKENYAAARELFFPLVPLIKALFTESNPIGVKAAMEIIGLPAGDPRLPLLPMTATHREKLKAILKR